MCPMCERRAQLLLQQQTIVESTPANGSKPSGNSHLGSKPSLFRNPFKACKHLTHQCCSPLCESQRTSGRRSSAIAPVSGELTYLVSESPLSMDPEPEPGPRPAGGTPWPELRKSRKQRKGLLTRLKALTHGSGGGDPKVRDDLSSNESSFGACGRKVMAVADALERNPGAPMATLLAPETDLDEEDEDDDDDSVAVTETDVSETTILSMMNMNGSFSSSPFREMSSYRAGSTLKSSAYDDDASSFAVVPRTSMNSSYVGRDGGSDASGLSDRFGELDIGYLSLEESGEGPEFDDTVSISSDQSEHLESLEMHGQAHDDTVSESDLDQEYSISTDSQEWASETEDAASVLQQRSRTSHLNRNTDLHRQTTPPPLPLQLSQQQQQQQQPLIVTPTTKNSSNTSTKNSGNNSPEDTTVIPPEDRKLNSKETTTTTNTQPSEIATPCTEYLCSSCGRKELGTQTTKNVTTKMNPMSTYFQTYMGGEDQAVVAAKVVVLLGKYGNRKGLRLASQLQGPKETVHLSAKELERLRSMISPNNDAVSAFQNEVARMMLEGVDVPDLNVDVEQFIAGYMKLHSPFYIDLIQDFFKSVCIDCFGDMERLGHHRGRAHQRPAYAVLKPRKTKSIAPRKLQ